jgi:hypothetical protein
MSAARADGDLVITQSTSTPNQVEVSRTIVLDAPRRARAFFEALIADNLDLGRPANAGAHLQPAHRSTRARKSRGSTLSAMSYRVMCSPQSPDETKQCAQCRLHRSVIWIKALRPSPSTEVRK